MRNQTSVGSDWRAEPNPWLVTGGAVKIKRYYRCCGARPSSRQSDLSTRQGRAASAPAPAQGRPETTGSRRSGSSGACDIAIRTTAARCASRSQCGSAKPCKSPIVKVGGRVLHSGPVCGRSSLSPRVAATAASPLSPPVARPPRGEMPPLSMSVLCLTSRASRSHARRNVERTQYCLRHERKAVPRSNAVAQRCRPGCTSAARGVSSRTYLKTSRELVGSSRSKPAVDTLGQPCRRGRVARHDDAGRVSARGVRLCSSADLSRPAVRVGLELRPERK